MPLYLHDGTGRQLDGGTCRLTIDAVDDNLWLRTSQLQRRITQQRVLQLVRRCITPLLHQIALCLSHSLTDGIAWSQYIVGKGGVHLFIITGIHRTGGAKESHTPTLRIKHHCLTDIIFLSVEGHDVA